MNQTETWIHDNLNPCKTDSACLKFNMPMQSGGNLLWIYEDPDYNNIYHWRDTAICEAFAEAVMSGKPGCILDVGPGDGWPSLVLAPRFERVVGIDLSATRVRVQRENALRLGIGNSEFEKIDVLQIGYPDATFDGVVAAASIEQSGDPERALRELFRVLKPGCNLAMTFENYDGREETDDLEVELSDSGCRITYTHCEPSPPREAVYVLSLQRKQAYRDSDVLKALRGIQEDARAWLADHSLVALLERPKDAAIDCRYCELSHLTSASLGKLLCDAGYVDIRGFDGSINGLMTFAQRSIEFGIAGLLKESFLKVSESFGAASVRAAKAGANDFTIAQKPLKWG